MWEPTKTLILGYTKNLINKKRPMETLDAFSFLNICVIT